MHGKEEPEEYAEIEVELDGAYEDLEVLEDVQIQEIMSETDAAVATIRGTNPAPRKRQRRNDGPRLHDRVILPPVGPYECEPCGKVYDKKTSFMSHYRDFHDRNPRRFVCEICGVAYTRDISLQGHMNVHAGLKPFKCDICGQGFARKYGVQNHMRSHTKEKKFFCHYCNKGFSFLTDKKRHETTHTGVHLYNCEWCKKGFNRKKALNEHEMEHVIKVEDR